MTAEERSERIEQYIRGQLSQSEMLAFEKEIKANPTLAEEVALEKELMESLMETDVRAFRTTLETVQQKKHRQRIIPFITKRIWAAAATVLVLIIAGYFLLDRILAPSSESLHLAHFKIPGVEEFMPPFILNNRGNNQGATVERPEAPPLQSVADLYRKEEYAKALEKMLTIQPKSTEEANYAYQLGVLYLVNNQPLKALENLAGGLTSNRAGTLWYQSMALLQLNRPDEAREKLTSLQSDYSPWQDEAKKVLKKLR